MSIMHHESAAQDAYLVAAVDFVRHGMERTGIPLSATLAHYLSVTVARFIRSPVMVDQLTVRTVRAMDENASIEQIRALADECLIACAFFEERLRRSGGTLRHFVGLGQASYDAARMTEQAYGFVHMRDVAGAAREDCARDARTLVDAARAGSIRAREALASGNVVVGPWGRRKGLAWG